MKITILLIILLNAFLCASQDYVQTKYGKIYGKSLRKYRNSVVGYFGIPFALAPIGKLRFKPPVPLEIKDIPDGFFARELARTCFFIPKYTGYIGMDYWHPRFLKYSEDCLQLNLWVPKKPSGAVLVYIFGRGYNSGSPSLDIYNGAVIAAKTKAIVVNINYRLDILGFATLGNGSVFTGNVGLLDQQLALRWVYKNIKYFGGNKKMITLFGEGTGAASVAAHLYSKRSSRYISKVILMSGSIKNTWAYQSNKIVSENVMKLAKTLNCSGSERKILKCLQLLDVTTLVKAANRIIHPEQSPLIHSFTIVESDNLFFKGNLTNKIFFKEMKDNFDILIGKTSNESTYFMTQYLSSEKYGCMIDPRKPIDSSFNACRMNKTNFYYAVKLLTSEYYLDDEDSFFIQRAYKNYNSPEYRDKTARLISDFTFDCDIVQYAKYISSFVKGNKYFFEYQLRSSSNPWPKWMGAMHGYEMEYFFGMPFRHFRRYRSDTFSYERSISEKLINMINNFMLTGKPYPKWDQFNEKKMNALIIDKKFCSRNTINYYDVFSDTCKVHDKILKKYPLWGRKFNNFRMKNHV